MSQIANGTVLYTVEPVVTQQISASYKVKVQPRTDREDPFEE